MENQIWCLTVFLPGFTGFKRVFTKFHRVLPSFTGFYRVLPGFSMDLTGFLLIFFISCDLLAYHSLFLEFTRFYLVFLSLPQAHQNNNQTLMAGVHKTRECLL